MSSELYVFTRCSDSEELMRFLNHLVKFNTPNGFIPSVEVVRTSYEVDEIEIRLPSERARYECFKQVMEHLTDLPDLAIAEYPRNGKKQIVFLYRADNFGFRFEGQRHV